MDTRTLFERREILKAFWESKVATLLKLKPSELIKPEDTTTIQEANQRAGAAVPDVSQAWTKWTSSYQKTLDLHDKEISQHAPAELAEIYGAEPGEPLPIEGMRRTLGNQPDNK